MVASDWQTVTNADGGSYSFFTRPIQKPQLDDREYRLIKLDNGLTATVIHDPNAHKAAACLDVAIGHLHDPVSQ
jgi:insulysin